MGLCLLFLDFYIINDINANVIDNNPYTVTNSILPLRDAELDITYKVRTAILKSITSPNQEHPFSYLDIIHT